jgi:hypothetical protein
MIDGRDAMNAAQCLIHGTRPARRAVSRRLDASPRKKRIGRRWSGGCRQREWSLAAGAPRSLARYVARHTGTSAGGRRMRYEPRSRSLWFAVEGDAAMRRARIILRDILEHGRGVLRHGNVIAAGGERPRRHTATQRQERQGYRHRAQGPGWRRRSSHTLPEGRRRDSMDDYYANAAWVRKQKPHGCTFFQRSQGTRLQRLDVRADGGRETGLRIRVGKRTRGRAGMLTTSILVVVYHPL